MKGQLSIKTAIGHGVLWTAIIMLTLVGLFASIHRGVLVADGGASAKTQFDRRFADHPVITFVHIVPGALFLTFAPFQFSVRVRTRYLRFHRWSGRLLVLSAIVSGSSGFVVGLPSYGGAAESSARVVFGALLLITVVRAFVAIRLGDVSRHREWMIRAFSIAIGISTIRIVTLILTAIAGRSTFQEFFGVSFWIGWVLTLVAAELWIRYTRPLRVGVRRAALIAARV